MISYFVYNRKRPFMTYEQTGPCHQSFQNDFVANCIATVWVSWKIGKVEKDAALNHQWKKKREQIRWCRNIYRDNHHAHSRRAFRNHCQTYKMELFARTVTIFASKKIYLWDRLYRDFQPKLKFQLLKLWRDLISPVKRQQCKNRIRLYEKI